MPERRVTLNGVVLKLETENDALQLARKSRKFKHPTQAKWMTVELIDVDLPMPEVPNLIAAIQSLYDHWEATEGDDRDQPMADLEASLYQAGYSAAELAGTLDDTTAAEWASAIVAMVEAAQDAAIKLREQLPAQEGDDDGEIPEEAAGR